MSHFTTVETKINDLQCLTRALKDLGYVYTEAQQGQELFVKGYQGQKTGAQIAIHASKTYDIGVKIDAKGNAVFVADWWGVETTRGVEETDFVKQVTRRYSYHKVMKEVEKKGFKLETEEVKEDQTIQIRVRTWK